MFEKRILKKIILETAMLKLPPFVMARELRQRVVPYLLKLQTIFQLFAEETRKCSRNVFLGGNSNYPLFPRKYVSSKQ